jgi:hypothetical protein
VNRRENLRDVDRYIGSNGLNHYMSRYADSAISVPYITLGMRVSDRQSAAKDD